MLHRNLLFLKLSIISTIYTSFNCLLHIWCTIFIMLCEYCSYVIGALRAPVAFTQRHNKIHIFRVRTLAFGLNMETIRRFAYLIHYFMSVDAIYIILFINFNCFISPSSLSLILIIIYHNYCKLLIIIMVNEV